LSRSDADGVATADIASRCRRLPPPHFTARHYSHIDDADYFDEAGFATPRSFC